MKGKKGIGGWIWIVLLVLFILLIAAAIAVYFFIYVNPGGSPLNPSAPSGSNIFQPPALPD